MLPKIELPKKFTDEEIVKQMEKEIPEQYMSFQTMLGMSSYRLIKMVYIWVSLFSDAKFELA